MSYGQVVDLTGAWDGSDSTGAYPEAVEGFRLVEGGLAMGDHPAEVPLEVAAAGAAGNGSISGILKRVFGYDAFLPLQREVIEAVLAQRNVLAVMPTGGGKSLCYQIPALVFAGLTVVVSPLIALMQDQVAQLQAAGVSAVFLNSTLSSGEYRERMDAVRAGQVRLLYVAPESLFSERVLGLLDSVRVDCLTIDEAHCISEWGHDFRPEYRRLAEIRTRYPGAVCLALTATATERVRGDIVASLGFLGENVFVAGFDRPNLFIEVAPKQDAAAQLLEFLGRFRDQAGIVYCFSRDQVARLAAFLGKHGFAARAYHAGLADDERRNNQEAFVRDDVQIIVATIAFGMGINKPDVRFVVHYDLPKSLENYYQEIGRAGRDGQAAHCLLFYGYGDAAKLRHFINQKSGPEREVAERHLEAITRYAEDLFTCRRRSILAYFGETGREGRCSACDTCTKEPAALIDVTLQAQKFLSCVIRTGERFGAAHVVDVLLGSRGEKVLRFGHESLSTHGIGKEWAKPAWMHHARQLIQQGYLVQNGEFRVLGLTGHGRQALRDRSPIMGTHPAGAGRKAAPANAADLPYDAALFGILREKRKALADQGGLPPYAVFPDRTLIEMAAFLPLTPDALRTVHGVGEIKAARYGEGFLELIRTFCQERGIEGRQRLAGPSLSGATARGPARHHETGEAYRDGMTIAGLAERYGVQPDTIVGHLIRFQAEGGEVRPREDLHALAGTDVETTAEVFAAFAGCGHELLKPVFERLGGRVGYGQLRVLRLLYLADRS